MPDWLTNLVGEKVAFWLSYLTDGRHVAFYKSFGYTLAAAFGGAAMALLFGLGGAALRRSRRRPLRLLGAAYANIVRGIPDVLFFLFFPLAFEQLLETIGGTNLLLSTTQYLLLACLSLGIVYGAFASSAINGAIDAVDKGQLEAARAFGMGERQVLWRVQVRQMWIYALPGLSNAWMLLIKATALLSLLQIDDIVRWADRLGAPNFLPRVGFVHPDWRWRYYLFLLVFYVILTFVSEQIFRRLRRRAGRGMIAVEA